MRRGLAIAVFAPAVLRVLRPEGAFTAPELANRAEVARELGLERRAADWLLVFVSSVLAFEFAIGVFGAPGRIVAAGLLGTLVLATGTFAVSARRRTPTPANLAGRVAPRSRW